MPENQTSARAQRKDHIGVVISKSGDKSVVVMVERRKLHERYGKTIRQSRKFHTHDEGNTAKVGDRVRIVEARPMSRLKRWRLADVIAGAKTA